MMLRSNQKRNGNSKKHWRVLSVITAVILLAAAWSSAFPALAANSYTYSADPSENQEGKATKKTWVQTSDNTWTMDINGDGVTDVTLESSKNENGDEVWTYTFNVEDDNQDYYVYERMLTDGKKTDDKLKEGYSSEGTDSEGNTSLALDIDPGKMVKTGDHTYTITNSKDHTPNTSGENGSITISKAVTGTQANPDQAFSFTIQLSGSTDALKEKINGSKVFGDTPFMDGKAVITLKSGENKTIAGIPAGTKYKVTETAVSGYTLSSKEGDSGTISKDTESKAAFTNESTYTPPENPVYVSFTLTKKVTGMAEDESAKYQFHVLLESLTPNAVYSYGDSTFTADDNGSADVALTLAKDDSILFKNLPDGATYQVMEEAGGYISSYTVTDKNSMGQIAQAEGANTEKGRQLSTAKEKADNGEDVTVTFTNDYPAVQNLTVRKYIKKVIDDKEVTSDKDSDAYKALSAAGKKALDEEADQEFEITVNFTGLDDGTVIRSDIGNITPDEYGEAVKTFNVRADGAPVVFYDVPQGVQYQVAETGNKYKPSYNLTVTDTNGKEVKGTLESETGSGRAGQDLSTEAETIDKNESDTVTFINEETDSINQSLPETGGNGIYAGLIAALLLTGTGYIIYRKNRLYKKEGR